MTLAKGLKIKSFNETPRYRSFTVNCAKGYAPASMALATMMANGNIIPQNLPQAKKIFTELANQNVPNAKESLASVDKIIAEKSKQAANAPAQPAPKNNK